jgi:hypothetical protein
MRVLPTALALALSVVICACGGDSGEQPPSGPLAETLADLDGGGENGSLGVGWAEPRLVEQAGGGPELIADAVGPNAGTVIEAAPALRRRFGLDPLEAERLVSVGGSYAFGLRLDGVDGRRLARALAQDGARVRRADQLEFVSAGGYAVVPDPLLATGVHGLGARDAFGRGLTVLAISGRARASLLGRGDRLIGQPIYRAAADCLGDVVAARMIPDKLLLSTELGFDLVAAGLRRDGREVLCILGGTPDRAEEVAAALETSLAQGAREPRTGTPIADLVSAADVTSYSYEDVQVVRADLTRAHGEAPGFLFDTISRGSIVELILGR